MTPTEVIIIDVELAPKVLPFSLKEHDATPTPFDYLSSHSWQGREAIGSASNQTVPASL